MELDLKKTTWLPVIMCVILLMHVVVDYNVYAFLLPVSLAVWGLCVLCFLAMFCIYIQEMRISWWGAINCSYFLLLIIFTIIQGNDILSAIYRTIETTLFLMIFYYYQSKIPQLIQTFALTFSLIIYINLALMLIFPDWIFLSEDTRYFLLGGNYNQMGGRLVCGIITSILCVRYNKLWTINVVLLFVASIITLAVVGSMTAISNVIVFALFCLIPSLFLKKIGLVSFFIFYVLFQVIVVFSGEGLHNNELAVYIIEDVLEKDLTFTNRTEMWDAAGKIFLESPIIGYGCVSNEWYVANMSSFAIGPHNFIYGVMINGGIVLLSIFLAAFVMAIYRMQSVPLDTTGTLLLISITTLLFMMTMEVYPIFFIVYLLTFVYYYPEIEATYEN